MMFPPSYHNKSRTGRWFPNLVLSCRTACCSEAQRHDKRPRNFGSARTSESIGGVGRGRQRATDARSLGSAVDFSAASALVIPSVEDERSARSPGDLDVPFGGLSVNDVFMAHRGSSLAVNVRAIVQRLIERRGRCVYRRKNSKLDNWSSL